MLALALAFSAQAQRPGQLRGTVTDKKSGEEQYQAIVRVSLGRLRNCQRHDGL